MKSGPNISRVAALMGDPARSNMLLSLMDGRALTASELASSSGITKQTASSHLAKLLAGNLVTKEVQGRHHYYRLSDPDVAQAIEALLNVAERGPGKRTRTGPKDRALRKSRICYDHLAGELGVTMYDRMHEKSWIKDKDGSIVVSRKGWVALGNIGLLPSDVTKSRRPQCKTCLDWSMRRHHLAGQVGALILSRILELEWAKRQSGSRVIEFSPSGEKSFRRWID